MNGIDDKGQPAKLPGFKLYSSQNRGDMAGRNSNDKGLLDHLHYIYMNDYSDAELVALAEKKVKYPSSFVTAFRMVEAEEKDKVNSRTFFNLLKPS